MGRERVFKAKRKGGVDLKRCLGGKEKRRGDFVGGKVWQ